MPGMAGGIQFGSRAGLNCCIIPSTPRARWLGVPAPAAIHIGSRAEAGIICSTTPSSGCGANELLMPGMAGDFQSGS
jgi:hypothetical protein